MIADEITPVVPMEVVHPRKPITKPKTKPKTKAVGKHQQPLGKHFPEIPLKEFPNPLFTKK